MFLSGFSASNSPPAVKVGASSRRAARGGGSSAPVKAVETAGPCLQLTPPLCVSSTGSAPCPRDGTALKADLWQRLLQPREWGGGRRRSALPGGRHRESANTAEQRLAPGTTCPLHPHPPPPLAQVPSLSDGPKSLGCRIALKSPPLLCWPPSQSPRDKGKSAWQGRDGQKHLGRSYPLPPTLQPRWEPPLALLAPDSGWAGQAALRVASPTGSGRLQALPGWGTCCS